MPRTPDSDRPAGPANAAESAGAKKTDAPEDDQTRIAQEGESRPRLPNERDTSADSQRHPGGGATRVGRQAHEDVERGLVDTDRGPEADRAYQKVKR